MSKLRAIKDRILCVDGDFGDKTTKHGIIVKATIGTSEGTTPRWFKVFEVGPDVDWIEPGQWVYVEYGRWSEGFTCNDDERLEEGQKVWLVENKACMAVADEKPETFNISSTDKSSTPFS